jgi:ElaB/YqjD/DUF883 family membrane-anchored ribosome-binding protein
MTHKASNADVDGTLQHTLERGVDKATAVAHESIDSASEAARPALDHMASSAHTAVDRAGIAASHAAGTVGGKGDRMNATGQKLIEQAGGFVRENPVASLSIAVAAGYFLSRIFSTR